MDLSLWADRELIDTFRAMKRSMLEDTFDSTADSPQFVAICAELLKRGYRLDVSSIWLRKI